MSDLRDLLNVTKNVRKQYQWADKAVDILEQAMKVENGLVVNQNRLNALQKRVDEVQAVLSKEEEKNATRMAKMEEEFRVARKKAADDLVEKRREIKAELDSLVAEKNKAVEMWEGKRVSAKEAVESLQKEVSDLASKKKALEADIEAIKARAQRV